MLVIPAIDIKNGKVVRLAEGDFDRETIYSDNPTITAAKWEKEGAKYLHLVDLDGARTGNPVNFDTVSAIMKTISIPVEVGGGIRTKKTVRKYIDAGCNRIILGTEACTRTQFVKEIMAEFGAKIAVAIDSREGIVSTHGWEKASSKTAVDLIEEMQEIGVRNIIFTDITKDGLLKGINTNTIKQILKSAGDSAITVAGGISSLNDIRKLKQLSKVRAVIIGKALYSGNIKLREALDEASV